MRQLQRRRREELLGRGKRLNLLSVSVSVASVSRQTLLFLAYPTAVWKLVEFDQLMIDWLSSIEEKVKASAVSIVILEAAGHSEIIGVIGYFARVTPFLMCALAELIFWSENISVSLYAFRRACNHVLICVSSYTHVRECIYKWMNVWKIIL